MVLIIALVTFKLKNSQTCVITFLFRANNIRHMYCTGKLIVKENGKWRTEVGVPLKCQYYYGQQIRITAETGNTENT